MSSAALKKFYRYQIRKEAYYVLAVVFVLYMIFLITIPDVNVTIKEDAVIADDETVYVLADNAEEFDSDRNYGYKINLKDKVHLGFKMANFNNATMMEKLQRWNKEFNFRVASSHEPVRREIIRLMLEYSEDNSVMVDSGAHLGDTSLPALEELRYNYGRKDIHLVLIEPDDSKCTWIRTYMKHLIKKHDDDDLEYHVHIINSGVWSHNTNAYMNRKGHPGSWFVQTDVYRLRELAKNRKYNMSNFKKGDIILKSIDNIIHPNATFALWHLDAENSETRALFGLLRTKHRPIIIMESMSVKKGNVDFMLNNDYLRLNYGYKLTKRLEPNKDRVLFPPHKFNNITEKELPYYV